MPTVRAIVRDAAKNGLPVLVVRSRRREERAFTRGKAQPAPTQRASTWPPRPKPVSNRGFALDFRNRPGPKRRSPKEQKPMFITKTHISRRAALRGLGATVALPFLDAMVPARTAFAKTAPRRRCRFCRDRDGARLGRQHRDRHREEPVGARRGRPRLRPRALVAPAPRAVPRAPHHRQQHRRAQRRGLRSAGNRRRPLPLERRVPHPDARPKQTEGSDILAGTSIDQLYAQRVGPGHADSVDAALHRERRPGRRLRLRLRLRLHRHHQLGRAHQAAAHDPRPARGLRPALRRGRHRGRARGRGAAPTRASSTGSPCEAARLKKTLGRHRPGPALRLPRQHPRDRTPHPEGRGLQHERRDPRDARGARSACPIRSRSTCA